MSSSNCSCVIAVPGFGNSGISRLSPRLIINVEVKIELMPTINPENKPIPNNVLGILLREFRAPPKISERLNCLWGIKFEPVSWVITTSTLILSQMR